MNRSFPCILLLVLFSLSTHAQVSFDMPFEQGGEYLYQGNNANYPCISQGQYDEVERRIADNIKSVGIPVHQRATTASTLCSWPLKTINGFKECGYYFIGNYVDQDTSSGLLDYNCGAVTYDGHRGVDIALYPFPFYKMDSNMVEVIAAAPGTIVDRADGNFDKNCAMNNSTANYIIVQHADGSVALYWHMKKNTVTTKKIGDKVVLGEYLGMVGSSGSSTAPHLHFEVWAGIKSNTLNDPYAGSCNKLNANSWWVTQKPYTEPGLLQVSVHSVLPVIPACPGTETPNEDNVFTAGSKATFAIFLRNETKGMAANSQILNPDGSTFTSWVHNSNSTYKNSYWYMTKTLPTKNGVYTFQSTFNGVSCSKKFRINGADSTTGIEAINASRQINIEPNPATNSLNVFAENMGNGSCRLLLKNLNGQVLLFDNTNINDGLIQKNLNISQLPNGIYFLSIESPLSISIKKIIKQ